jgi:hypothetical protein
MPVILRDGSLRFLFFSNEGNPLEPVHIHVRKDNLIAKFWLEPNVRLAENYGFSASELNKISRTVEENKQLFIQNWNEYFNI